MLIHTCPSCGTPVPYGRPRCDACQARYEERQAERRRDFAREYAARKAKADDPRYAAFYRSKEWRRLAAAVLSERGFRCEHDGDPAHPRCRHIACEVHHEPPIRTPEGWEHRLDPGHLHCLCTECHNERHGRFQRRHRGGKAGPARPR